MNTRKYDASTRKNMKRQQRSPEYQRIQRQAFEERTASEATIKDLKAKVVALTAKADSALGRLRALGVEA
jgi:hypothetical protein